MCVCVCVRVCVCVAHSSRGTRGKRVKLHPIQHVLHVVAVRHANDAAALGCYADAEHIHVLAALLLLQEDKDPAVWTPLEGRLNIFGKRNALA